jgi:hypothetical protein
MTNPYEPPSTTTEATGGPAIFDAVADNAVQKAASNALMFSVGGLLCCAPLGFVGITRGNAALTTIALTGAGIGHRSTAKAAVVIGYVGLAIWIVGFVMKMTRLAE